MSQSQTAKTNSDASLSNANSAGRGGKSMPAVPVLQQKGDQASTENNMPDLKAGPIQLQSSAPVQRRVKIGKEVFLNDQRHFISRIQAELPRHGYSVPNKLLIACAQAIKKEGPLHDTSFDTFDDFIDEMVRLELTSSRVKTTSVLERPKTLGKRPAFHAQVAVERNRIKELRGGVIQAARHVIPSHLLGYASENVVAPVGELKAWVEKNGNDGLPLKPTLNMRVQKRNIWIILHNHVGNLWIGKSLDNTVVGFLSGGIQSVIRDIVKSENPISVIKGMIKEPGTGELGREMAKIMVAAAGAFAAIVEEYNLAGIEDDLLKAAAAMEMHDALTEVWEQVEGDVPSFNLEEYELASSFMTKFKNAPTLELFTEFMSTKFSGSSF